jgi:hypothetical protein
MPYSDNERDDFILGGKYFLQIIKEKDILEAWLWMSYKQGAGNKLCIKLKGSPDKFWEYYRMSVRTVLS